MPEGDYKLVMANTIDYTIIQSTLSNGDTSGLRLKLRLPSFLIQSTLIQSQHQIELRNEVSLKTKSKDREAIYSSQGTLRT